MADCKNCLHCEVCADVMKKDLFIKEKMLRIVNPICKCFLNKSKVIELPCKVGDYVYSIFSRQCWYLSRKDSLPKAKVVFVGLTNSDDMGGGYFEVLYEDFLCFVRYTNGRMPVTNIAPNSIICLVGPSGSGKNEIADEACRTLGFKRLATTTTCKGQNGGNDRYEHITQDEFFRRRAAGDFIETTVYGGEHYGVMKSTLDDYAEGEYTAIVPMDMCGAMAVKNLYPERTVTVFVEKDKYALVDEILNKDIPQKEKIIRLLGIDSEIANKQFCDFTISTFMELRSIMLQRKRLV